MAPDRRSTEKSLEDKLEKRLERLFAAVEGVAGEVEADLERRARKAQRREHRKRRREKKRGPEGELATGVVFLVAAAVMTVLALSGRPFWFVFVALGLGIAGAQRLSAGLAQSREEASSEAEEEVAAKKEKAPETEQAPSKPPRTPDVRPASDVGRVDQVAAQLLQEIKTGPPILREILRTPERTVEGLRRACRSLWEREVALRAALRPEDDRRLSDEEADLERRIGREEDAVARSRFEEALGALRAQRKERAEMATAANRLEAERTRLRLTLESLHAQVVKTRTVHGAGGEDTAALRQGLERLSDEIGAVAEALESVGAEPGFSPIAPIEPGGDERSPGAPVRTR